MGMPEDEDRSYLMVGGVNLTWLISLMLFLATSPTVAETHAPPSPTKIIQRAIDLWRGQTSFLEDKMVVHRPDWERTMAMISWTRGEKDALIRFTAPKKDAGNATLKLGSEMWLFTPRLNQVIKLPESMMAQSWMGSDFSYNDLAKSDHILFDFTHEMLRIEQQAEHRVYWIKLMPKPDAPVVWGKEVLAIRDDYVLLEQQFFDQDMKMVKRMRATKIGQLDHRPYPLVLRMENLEKNDQWTEVSVIKGQFNLALPDYLFTQSNLRNPRR